MAFLPEQENTNDREETAQGQSTGGTSDKDVLGGSAAESTAGEPAGGNRPWECPAEITEGQQTVYREDGRSGFGSGFLAGILTALVCVAVFMLGWFAAEYGIFGTAENQVAGVEVLTDSGTSEKLAEIQNIIEKNYLNDVDSEYLAAYLFKGLAAGLKDDYAGYYSAEELQSVRDSSNGEYYGIGVTISKDAETGELSVAEVYEGSPADQGGMRQGDIVTAVDGVDVTSYELSEVVAMIKAKKGEFTIRVYRPDTDGETDITLECSDVELVCVKYEMVTDTIGCITLSEFTAAAVDQFTEAAFALYEQGMEKLIVDLRDNPGGLLTSVCDILDEILPEGLIVYTEDRYGSREEYSADGDRTIGCEVAVLVNGGSASASEIFAGAIQDYGIGPVIGTQTYGKGVVQKTFQLSDGSALKLTVEKYYTPNGQDIDGNGITPDIIVEETQTEESDPVLERAIGELS